LLEAQALRLEAELVFTRAGELRERPRRRAEYRVTDLEARHLAADGLHHAAHVHAEHALLRLRQARREPHRVRLAGHEVPLAVVEAGGLHANQHFVLPRHGALERGEVQHFGVAVLRMDDGLHDASPCRGHDHARGAWVERCP